MNDYLISVIRTIVPMIVGALIAVAADLGFEIDSAALEVVLFQVVSGLYYVVVRLLEQKFPEFGWLLGWKPPAAPTYQPEV